MEIYAAFIGVVGAVLGVAGGYVLGHRRLRYERLYEKRAGVIAQLSEHLFLVQRGFGSWAKPFQTMGVNRDEQRKAASDAFDELVVYYHSNSVWLPRRICEKIESVMETTYDAAWDYVDNLDDRGYPRDKEGRDASKKLWRDLPVLRQELEEEFRTILYPPPWYDLPLRLLERVPSRKREPNEPGRDPDTF